MKLAVLLSGAGSTLDHLANQKDMEIALAISQNNKAISVIQKHKIPFLMTTNQDLIQETIRLVKCDLIVLAGYTRLLSIPPDFKNKILNIHPSLLPQYGGKGMFDLKVHQAVIAGKEKKTGCTVHLVDEEYDHGVILAQSIVDVESEDTAETLQQKVKTCEKVLYPQVIRSYWKNIKVQHE